jgi:hypothetical protein
MTWLRKAANCGGVAVSALEMTQNACFTQWTPEKVDKKLKAIMIEAYGKSMEAAKMYGRPNDIMVTVSIQFVVDDWFRYCRSYFSSIVEVGTDKICLVRCQRGRILEGGRSYDCPRGFLTRKNESLFTCFF